MSFVICTTALAGTSDVNMESSGPAGGRASARLGLHGPAKIHKHTVKTTLVRRDPRTQDTQDGLRVLLIRVRLSSP